MILYEFEGKELLKKAGIEVPKSLLVDPHTILQMDSLEILKQVQDDKGGGKGVVAKAQVLSGKRAEAGGILFAENIEDLRLKIKDLLGREVNKEKVEKVLVEEQIEGEKEFYLSISYDTDVRAPVLSFSQSGGTGIEERGVEKFIIDPISRAVIPSDSEESPDSNKEILKQVQDDKNEGIGNNTTPSLRATKGSEAIPVLTPEIASSATPPRNDDVVMGTKSVQLIPEDLLKSVIELFFSSDCLLLEINPLVRTKDGKWVALDAKVKLDDDAKKRHEEWSYPPRLLPGHAPTQREVESKKIDEGDYRGTAGSAYLDLEGDIAVLSSGGGVSLTAMDALIAAGGKPANFTEYSGNPPKEKVVKLTKIVLSKENIHGLWVIGTVAANFTDIYETLSGLIEGLREAQKELVTEFKMPIVIRRGGPRVKEAYQMLSEVKDFDLHLQGEEVSIAASAKVMAELAEGYAQKT